MDVMAARRRLMQQALNNGWRKKIITASVYCAEGKDVINNVIAPEMPSNYRWAVALAEDPSNPVDYGFLGMIFLKSRTDVHGLRWHNGYQGNPTINGNGVSCVVNIGDKIILLWRTEPIGSDNLALNGWNYSLVTSGEITRASEMQQEITNVAVWNAIISIADYDFSTMLSANFTYCESIALSKTPFSGHYVRTNNGVYQPNDNWGSAFGCNVPSGTRIINFYI